jgi:hypothetical protein
MKTPATQRPPKPRRDPVVVALRRLLNVTDKSLALASEMRQARVELAKLVEGQPRE